MFFTTDAMFLSSYRSSTSKVFDCATPSSLVHAARYTARFSTCFARSRETAAWPSAAEARSRQTATADAPAAASSTFTASHSRSPVLSICCSVASASPSTSPVSATMYLRACSSRARSVTRSQRRSSSVFAPAPCSAFQYASTSAALSVSSAVSSFLPSAASWTRSAAS
eukprot:699050-Prymnesium_polylepis.1